MADTRTVTPTAGTTVYTGAGAAPHHAGERVKMPADHAADLVDQGVVTDVPAPAAPEEPQPAA